MFYAMLIPKIMPVGHANPGGHKYCQVYSMKHGLDTVMYNTHHQEKQHSIKENLDVYS